MAFMTFRRPSAKEKIAQTVKGILGVRLTQATLSEGRLTGSHDAQIAFRLKDFIARTAALVQIELIVERSSAAPRPVLHIAYGRGASHAMPMLQRTDGKYIAFVPFPNLIETIRLTPFYEPAAATIVSLVARRASAHDLAYAFMRDSAEVTAGVVTWRAERWLTFLRERLKTFSTDDEVNQSEIASLFATALAEAPPDDLVSDLAYRHWIARNEAFDEADLAWMRAEALRWPRQPLLSVLMPVFDPPIHLLEEAVASLRSQTYENWELCIADDASRNAEVRTCIARLAAEDARIKPVYRSVNGHISEATNSAAEIARGEYVVLMDNDDLLPRHALWTVAHYALAHPDAAMFYSDEDKLNLDGVRMRPHFKGEFDRFLMLGHNMVTHLGIYRRDVFETVGGFRKGYEGSQDYDLTLRCLDAVGEDRIVHIPHVLYHWRQLPGSTAISSDQKNYAFEAAKRAIDDHFARNAWPLQSIDADVPGLSNVRTLSLPDAPRVTLVIPTRKGHAHLAGCIESIRRFSDPLMDVVIVDNGPGENPALAGLACEAHRFRVVRDEGEFTRARLFNVGVAAARGSIVCLLYDATEFLDAAALERARAFLSIREVGIVGARLLAPDRTIRHFGIHVGVGEGGIADHAYRGLPDHLDANFGKSILLQQFSAVSAACLFVRKDTFTAVNGFDEAFPEADSEIDFCLRVRRHGLKVICDPGIRLIQHDAGTEKPARREADVTRMLARHGAAGLTDPFYSPNFGVARSSYAPGIIAPGAPWKAPGKRQKNA